MVLSSVPAKTAMMADIKDKNMTAMTDFMVRPFKFLLLLRWTWRNT